MFILQKKGQNNHNHTLLETLKPTSSVEFFGQLPFTVMFLLGSMVSSSVLLRSVGLVGTVIPSSIEATIQPPGTVQLP